MANGVRGKISDEPAEAAIEWHVRLTSGHATDADWAAHAEWMAEDPRHAAAFAVVQLDFERLDAARGEVLARYPVDAVTPPLSEGLLSGVWQAVAGRRPLIVAGLAAVLVAIVAGATLLPFGKPDVVALNTAIGEVRQVVLADGSTVDLDTDTALKASIDSHRRMVRLLRGRAIFDVHHEQDRPFVVIAAGRQVRDLGTRFEVSAIGDSMSVAVARGRVSVTPERQSAVTSPEDVVTPGTRLIFPAAAAAAPSRQAVDIDDIGRWKEGWLTFNSAPLSEVLAAINRYFPGEALRVGDPGLENRMFTGSLYLDKREALAQNLAGMMSLSYHREGDVFVLEAVHND